MTGDGPAPRVAVTGAHGYLGAHVVAALLRAGLRVRAVASPWGATDRLAPYARAIEPARADVTDPATLAGVFDGCDAVVHAAARVADHGPPAAFERVN